MDQIRNLSSQGYALFAYARNRASQIIPDENNRIRKAVSTSAEVFKGVVYGTVPHLVNMSPMYLSRLTNMRVVSVVLFLRGQRVEMEYHRNWMQTAISRVMLVVNFIGWAELMGHTSLEIEYRFAVDGLLLLGTVIGSSRAIYRGTKQISSSWNPERRNTASKVSDFVSGFILITFGAMNMQSVVTQGWGLILASNVPNPDKLALKHRVVKQRFASAVEQKECNAVFIDGLFSRKTFLSKMSNPFAEVIYEKCRTISYDVGSSEQFCEAMTEARTVLAQEIDVLAINSHATNREFTFDNGYVFNTTKDEIDCINKNLASEAQVFLLGCNTATPTVDGSPTLTKRMSRGLPGKEVTGFSATYNPWFLTTSYSNGRFKHDNHWGLDSNGDFVNPISTAVVEKSISQSPLPRNEIG